MRFVIRIAIMSKIWTPPYPPLRFTADQAAQANEEWGANCGPHSIAAACGLTLDEVRAKLVNFRGWMNPTQITETLGALGRFGSIKKGNMGGWIGNGIHRIQWEGPWMNPGVPARVAYKHTHYIAAFLEPTAVGGGWILCTAICPWAWVHIDEWHKQTEARGDKWHVTHHWTVLP